MRGLIYKHLFAVKSMISIIALTLLVGISSLSAESDIDEYFAKFIMFSGILFFSSSTSMGEIMKDSQQKYWSGFVISSPLMARGYVKSLYLVGLTFDIGIISVMSMVSMLCQIKLEGVNGADLALLFPLCCCSIFIKALEIPFQIRFGYNKGNSIKAVIVIAVFLAAYTYFLFGDISMFSSQEAFWNRLMDIASGDAMLCINALIPLITLGAYYLSYRISCSLMQKGAAEYD